MSYKSFLFVSVLLIMGLMSCSDGININNEYEAPSVLVDNSENYGVRWCIDNPHDLGARCFGAAGKEARIGIGSRDGYSDFDTIFPWSEIKRCNVKDNGTSIVFEGEPGFALDGSNGDVMVRIPKFAVQRYIRDGYEYRIISREGTPHPAFIENGNTLDAVYVSAYEGYVHNEVLCSIADVIPTTNMTPQEFLASARNKGKNYTLYDMRTVDLLFSLMAVEFGCRNSSVVLGHGVSQYLQPIEKENYYPSEGPRDVYYSIDVARQTNQFTCMRKYNCRKITVGSNICICRNTQDSIVTVAKVVAIVESSKKNTVTYHFDGAPVDIDKDCFVGSGAQSTNWTETCGNYSGNMDKVALKWHTGRANMTNGFNPNMRNPMRYRWIENIVGNVWHYLPDVTFSNLQMYVCDDMSGYQMHKTDAPYVKVGEPCIKNDDLSVQIDKRGVNYWVDNLMYDSGVPFIPWGASINRDLLSTEAFGAYYYLRDGLQIIANGGGFDHEMRSNLLTNRAWIYPGKKWYLYGARLLYKPL